MANRSEVDALVQAAFAKQDSHNMRKQLQAAAIAFGAINTSVDLVEHDLVRMETVPTPTGHAEVIASPILTTAPANRQRAVPAIGQHTAAIKEEFASP